MQKTAESVSLGHPDKIADQNLKNFVETGVNADKSKRFQNVSAMVSMLKKI